MRLIFLVFVAVSIVLAFENDTSSQLGLLCGWSVYGYTPVLCNGLDPLRVGCPHGYSTLVAQGSAGAGALCVKSIADGEPGQSGTWCGFPNEFVGCGDGGIGGCPIGYREHSFWNWCFKNDSKSKDLPGTLCGISMGRAGWQPDSKFPCGGMPTVNECPTYFKAPMWQRNLPSCYSLA